ncbi:hypothetical protein [Pedobacter sp. NJ-S-72]
MRTSTLSFLLLIIVLLGCSKKDYTALENTDKYGGLKSPNAGEISINNATITTFRGILSTKLH